MRAALVCAALAAVSLLFADQATYDPTAWILWGRQISEGTLDTVAGPSWKPLPVLFTAPFGLLGDDAAMSLWVVVARTGGLLSLVAGYRVASRLADSRAAGVVAVAALVLATSYWLNWMRGNSEGLLVFTALMAIDRHLAGKERDAFLWGVATGLLRPDVWLLLGLYGLWLLRRHPVLVLGGGAAVLALWLVPEYIGSGDLLRAATRAREVVPGSPGASESPFLTTFTNGAQAVSYGVYAGAVLSLGAALRHRAVAAVALGSAVLMVTVAAMASGGFTGSLRYVALPMALLCVLSGVGWAWLAGRVPRPVVALAALAALPGLIGPVQRLADNAETVRAADRLYGSLAGFIEDAGGRDAVLACGDVYTGPYNTPALAYRLHVRQQEVGLDPRAPGTVLDGIRSTRAGTPGFAVKVRGTEWILSSTC